MESISKMNNSNPDARKTDKSVVNSNTKEGTDL